MGHETGPKARRRYVRVLDDYRGQLAEEEVRRNAGEVQRPAPPDDLREAGQALWQKIHDDLDDAFELDAREGEILRRACRQADLAARLQADLDERGMWIEG